MATVQPPDRLTFSPDSLELRDRIRDRLAERLRQLAIEHARAERRDRVTEDDVKANIKKAVREILVEFGYQLEE